MKVLGVNLSHNASIAIVEDGKLLMSLEEERLSKLKKDNRVTNLFNKIKNSYKGNVSSPIAANISAARQGGLYKPGGLSQALISGAITPENLAMLGYRSGQVTSAQEQNIALKDVSKIKTTLTSAL